MRIIMSVRALTAWLGAIGTGLAASLAFPLSAAAQVPPPVPVNPQAPNLAPALPLGMQRGTSLDLTLTGTNLAGPTKLWTSFPAKVTIPTDMNNGKDNARLRVRLEVPKDAPLGYHTIRLATTRGISNFRLFCIDDLPQVMMANNNRTRETAQALQYPCVVVGRADAEVSDYFKVTVKAGQRLSFEVLGRRLGSAFDPQLTLYDARTGKEMPDGHSNDAPGCQTDPRLTYTFKDAGDYLVEIRDVMYRGGGDFHYRLRVGDFPCATTPIPMAARRGSRVKVGFAGPTVDGVAPVEVAVPSDPTVDTVWVSPRGANGLSGWPVGLAISDHDEVVEQEPNNEPAKATRIPVPGGVTGRFQEKGDVDCYVFAAKKGQRYVIEAQTHELYSPTEVYLVLKDVKGAQLAASNPTVAPRIDFTAPADGDFVLVVEHLLYWGGPSETYHLTVTPFAADFSLAIGIDRFDVPQGAVAAVSLFALRAGYAGAIDVRVVGPAGIEGHTTIPAGQPAAPNLPAGLLLITAKADMPVGAYAVVIEAKAVIDGKPVVRLAGVRTVVAQGLANLPYPPRQLLHQVGVAVTEKPPFTLTAKLDLPEAVRGVPATLTITATRTSGFVDPIALEPFGLPPGVVPALKPIPQGLNEVKVQLTAAVNVPVGTYTVSVTGKAKFQNRDYAVTAFPAKLVLALPFDLKVEGSPVQITGGGKAKVKVQAVRKGGYAGPLTLALRNLPANVTAPAATIAAGQAVVEIEITAGANAAVGDHQGVNVLGTATAAGNQQNASANFVVRVVKK
jgi:hypothetical protein